MFIPTWLGITPYVLAANRWAEIKQEIGGRMGKLALMALFDFAGYGAVLAAMALSKVSYILALRQTSVTERDHGGDAAAGEAWCRSCGWCGDHISGSIIGFN